MSFFGCLYPTSNDKKPDQLCECLCQTNISIQPVNFGRPINLSGISSLSTIEITTTRTNHAQKFECEKCNTLAFHITFYHVKFQLHNPNLFKSKKFATTFACFWPVFRRATESVWCALKSLKVVQWEKQDHQWSNNSIDKGVKLWAFVRGLEDHRLVSFGLWVDWWVSYK